VPRPASTLVALAVAWLVPVAGVVAYVQSPAHSRHDPDHALQQLDLLYLDEPAPDAARLGVTPGRVTLLLFCGTCEEPKVRGAEVRRVTDPEVAADYALRRRRGAVGPGYALVDGRGHVRYRTYDPEPAEHLREVQPLVDALRDP
jgi:hypothetical protein